MTIEQMHEAFEIRFGTLNQDKVFTSTEISYYLNLAQRTIFEELLKDYDSDDRVKVILYGLLKSKKFNGSELVAPTLGGKPNSKIVTLPDDFKVAKGESAQIQTSSGIEKIVRVKSISQDYYNLNINNPFKKPCEDLVWRLDSPEYQSDIDPDNNEIDPGGNEA